MVASYGEQGDGLCHMRVQFRRQFDGKFFFIILFYVEVTTVLQYTLKNYIQGYMVLFQQSCKHATRAI